MSCSQDFVGDNDRDNIYDTTANEIKDDDCQQDCSDALSLGHSSNASSDSESNESDVDDNNLT